MIRSGSRSWLIASVFATIAAVVMLVPVRVRAASMAGDDDDASEAPRLMVMDDFNRDGIADIAEATAPSGDRSGPTFLTVLLGQPDGTFKQMASNPTLGNTPRSIIAGDFNGDGFPDVIAGDDDGTLTLFVGDGTGKLAPAGEIAHLDSVVSIAVADFNHDGIPDLAVSDWRASSVTILLGAGKGSFKLESSFALRMRGTVPHIAVADFNGDHIPDLAVVYGDDDGDTYDVMLGNGKGSFTAAPELSVVRDPNSHCVT